MTDRAALWDELHDLLPEWWRVGSATYDPGAGRWSVTAYGRLRGGRTRTPPEAVTGTGATEVEALGELVEQLRQRGSDPRPYPNAIP